MVLSIEDYSSLKDWKYKVEDNSYLSAKLDKVYERIAENVPYIITPNMLSLFGLICSIGAWCYSQHMNENYIYKLISIYLIICYTVFDAIDGKHARNTNRASPLGEFVDHYFDCITNVLFTDIICTMYDVDIMSRNIIIFLTQTIYMLTHNTAYKTGIIKFDIIGPTECILGLILLMLFNQYIKIELLYALLISTCIYKYNKINGFFILLYTLLHGIRIYIQPNAYLMNGFMYSTLTGEIIIAKLAQMKEIKMKLFEDIIFFHGWSLIYNKIGAMYFIIKYMDICNVMNYNNNH